MAQNSEKSSTDVITYYDTLHLNPLPSYIDRFQCHFGRTQADRAFPPRQELIRRTHMLSRKPSLLPPTGCFLDHLSARKEERAPRQM